MSCCDIKLFLHSRLARLLAHRTFIPVVTQLTLLLAPDLYRIHLSRCTLLSPTILGVRRTRFLDQPRIDGIIPNCLFPFCPLQTQQFETVFAFPIPRQALIA